METVYRSSQQEGKGEGGKEESTEVGGREADGWMDGRKLVRGNMMESVLARASVSDHKDNLQYKDKLYAWHVSLA